jgi:hypothetical protein
MLNIPSKISISPTPKKFLKEQEGFLSYGLQLPPKYKISAFLLLILLASDWISRDFF